MEERKEKAADWFKSLRNEFCQAFEDIDEGKFERKTWQHKGEGGGEMSIMKGNVFEKVGVNISTVSGQFSEDYRDKIKSVKSKVLKDEVGYVRLTSFNDNSSDQLKEII